MSRVAYVNGRYLPHATAAVHIEDRGYQFADGVYEVCEVLQGHLVDLTAHLNRLDRSLRELNIQFSMSRNALKRILEEVLRKNLVKNGIIYLQVTRGVSSRNHFFPSSEVKPSLVVTARSVPQLKKLKAQQNGIAVITTPENRWERVDIKTIGLLPNVLAKQKARDAGAGEAWFVDKEGFITEGSSTNAWIVTKDNVLLTRPDDHGILKGVTRSGVVKLAEMLGFQLEERPFTVYEAQNATEAFVTSASGPIVPVVKVDGTLVGDGSVGLITHELIKTFHERSELTKLAVA
ncbi:D-amino-acid transaminase [Flexibacterium corallicola]|uniref:D-amino-acid transaminase n=1 Tax=Flexibacterium corallicola TaxID=3037259 RepID=UPI00286F5EA7|nr:D-amino-acid transaminase [Pseudovibrio sp. M1P-2-3]